MGGSDMKVGVNRQGQQVLPSQNKCLDLRIQAGQFAVNGLPDHFKVHLVVAVRNAIAHRTMECGHAALQRTVLHARCC